MTATRRWCEFAVEGIGCFYSVLSALVAIHDKGKFGKKITLYGSVWMTWWASKWSFDYATILLTKDAATLAAGGVVVIGVMTPVIGLTGWVLKTYLAESTESQRIIANQGGD
jgi:hypothetical protein